MNLHTTIKNLLPIVLVALFLQNSWGQTNDSTIFDWRRGPFPKEKESKIYQLKATGFYRFFATNLNMIDPYIIDENSGAVTKQRTLFIGDDTQLPNLLVNISGRPNKKTSWGFDLFAFQFLNGEIGPSYSGPVDNSQRPTFYNPLAGVRLGGNMGLNLGLNVYGSYLTDVGTFNIRMGGIHWFSISDLTLGSFRGYNRFMLYERNPWDPIGRDVGTRYEQMYKVGAVNQDTRWGERAVGGVILEGLSLPDGWSFAALYGKTELAGGFNTIPNINYGGRLRKTFKNGSYLSFNTLNNTSWVDSLNTTSIGFNLFTLEYKGQYKGFDIQAEVGPGRYLNPVEDYPWGEAISVKIQATKRMFKFPVELHYYRISPYVVNNNAVFWNTAINESSVINLPDQGGLQSNVLTPFSSSMVALGQMTNNRTGINLNTEVQVGKFKLSAGYGVATEIEAFQNQITYSHFVNQFTRARLWRWNFPSNIGPYGRYSKVYRDAFQMVTVTDDSLGVSVNPKKFNNLELHGKFHTKIAHRNFFAFFLGRYNTAQPEFSILPDFSEDAYIRQFNTEMELYYQILEPLFINSYVGYERVLGGYNTELNSETFRPLNQTGWGVGAGFDVSLSKNAGLYFRHRWIFFEDTSYPLDAFEGQETLVELKVFF